MQEYWKDVKGYEGYYQVSNKGNVRGVDRIVRHSGCFTRIHKGRMILQNLDGSGYPQLGLYKDGVCRKRHVHRIVALAFMEINLDKSEVNHIDENKTNNNLSNLEWCTKKENNNYGTKIQRTTAHTNYKSIALKNSKPVIQYDINRNEVKRWGSLAEIYKEKGYSTGNISICCNGKYKKPLYGFYWEYEENNNNG